MTPIITSVATGPRFCAGLDRLLQSPHIQDEKIHVWRDTMPDEFWCPSHQDIPYGFKIVALENFRHRVVLWMDSAIVPLQPLGPLWDLIESQGYWFSRNYSHMTGSFCCDAALPILGMTREELFEVPHVVAGTFGLDLRTPIAQEFMREWKRLAVAGAFAGPWRNDNGEASSDRRVLGHRHDQTAASVVAYRLGMKLTDPPKYFAEQGEECTSETILTVQR